MSRSVVPRNALQSFIHKNEQDHYAPDPFALMQVECKIIEVFDSETLEQYSENRELLTHISQAPGLLFALVELSTGKRYLLPFRESEDQIYSTYGNAELIKNRQCWIHYRNASLDSGSLVVSGERSKTTVDIRKASKVLDIGGII